MENVADVKKRLSCISGAPVWLLLLFLPPSCRLPKRVVYRNVIHWWTREHRAEDSSVLLTFHFPFFSKTHFDAVARSRMLLNATRACFQPPPDGWRPRLQKDQRVREEGRKSLPLSDPWKAQRHSVMKRRCHGYGYPIVLPGLDDSLKPWSGPHREDS